jgi:ubiquinone/menaquinone biosynthesis C-methylase UbiE
MQNKLYDDHYLDKFVAFFEKTKARSYELLAINSTDTILDVGCGTGADLLQISNMARNAIGVDHDAKLLAKAQEKTVGTTNIKYLCNEADNIEIESGTVDKIRYDRIFQHLPNHKEVILEARRLLKPNGIIQIIDPDYLGMTFFMENIHLERKIMDAVAYKRHSNSHKVRAIPNLLKACGFEILSVEIHNYNIKDFDFANFAINFREMIKTEFESGFISKAEFNEFNNQPIEPFNMSLNLMIIMGKKIVI